VPPTSEWLAMLYALPDLVELDVGEQFAAEVTQALASVPRSNGWPCPRLEAVTMVGTNLQTMIEDRAINELLEIAASQRHRNDIPLQQLAFRLCRLYDAENVLARLQPWVLSIARRPATMSQSRVARTPSRAAKTRAAKARRTAATRVAKTSSPWEPAVGFFAHRGDAASARIFELLDLGHDERPAGDRGA
jgi:hypothetical protein